MSESESFCLTVTLGGLDEWGMFDCYGVQGRNPLKTTWSLDDFTVTFCIILSILETILVDLSVLSTHSLDAISVPVDTCGIDLLIVLIDTGDQIDDEDGDDDIHENDGIPCLSLLHVSTKVRCFSKRWLLLQCTGSWRLSRTWYDAFVVDVLWTTMNGAILY